MRPRPGSHHEVEQGESVESVAAATGHAPETIWDAPENRELKAKRPDPHLLLPGDRLFVPPVKPTTFKVPTGSPASFVGKRPGSRLRLQVVEEGKPRASEKYLLVVDGVEIRGTTDGDGWVEQPMDPRTRKAHLTVGEGERVLALELLLRALDPVEEVSGQQGRLRNLGYDVGPADGQLDGRTRAALAAFQAARGLQVTGTADAATRDELVAQHGS